MGAWTRNRFSTGIGGQVGKAIMRPAVIVGMGDDGCTSCADWVWEATGFGRRHCQFIGNANDLEAKGSCKKKCHEMPADVQGRCCCHGLHPAVEK